jgi:phosphoribosylaminoimidazolecarboxamide formyltransferase/IMP cyclohydrolase
MPAEAAMPAPGRSAAVSPTAAIRTAGGAVLVSTPDGLVDDPARWTVVTRRSPSLDERADLELAWRLVRGVMSNAIVLVKDRALIGIGSGQTSRVDAARGAVEKARRFAGIEALIGGACASDAFYPFPDAVQACLDAGIAAFVQPGGSIRDADAIAAADAAGATMLLTATRHFRH